MRWTLSAVRPLRLDGTEILETPSLDRVRRSLERVLSETPLCAWATVTAAGQAHVNIGYAAVSDRLDFYLLSHPASLHCQNLAANPSLAVAVFASPQGWTEPGRGMQLFGTCAQAAGEQVAEAERVYGERFAAYAPWRAGLKAGDPGLEYRLYRFTAERIKILDESEFGDAVLVEADVVRPAEV